MTIKELEKRAKELKDSIRPYIGLTESEMKKYDEAIQKKVWDVTKELWYIGYKINKIKNEKRGLK